MDSPYGALIIFIYNILQTDSLYEALTGNYTNWALQPQSFYISAKAIIIIYPSRPEGRGYYFGFLMLQTDSLYEALMDNYTN